MANNFPTSLNTHKKDWSNTTPVKDTHPEEHNDIAGAVEALEAKVGVDNSVDHDSHDYKLSRIGDDDRAASDAEVSEHIADTSNPHSVTKSQIGLENVDNTSDATKNSAAAVLENKTIDADDNDISNLELDNFKANVIDTDVTLAASSNSRIPSQNAVKVYVDEKAGGGIFPPKFGDARDGTVTISGTETLTEDKYYNNLTVESGAILNTGGYRIYVAGTLTNEGTIRNNGGNGGNAAHSTAGSPGAAGAAGTPAPGVTVAAPAASGAGAIGVSVTNASVGVNANGNNGYAGSAATNTVSTASGAGGSGGTATIQGSPSSGGSGGSVGASNNEDIYFVPTPPLSLTLSPGSEDEFLTLYHFLGENSGELLSALSGTGGGGSGGARTNIADSIATSGSGGGGGGNGGIVYIVAKIIVNDGVIEAKGGAGGNGGNAANSGSWSVAGGGGTGAGGCGGVVLLAYSNLSGSGTIDVSGGSPGPTVGTGVQASGTASAATVGETGSSGVVFKVKCNTAMAV